jgi:hypothetical protein
MAPSTPENQWNIVGHFNNSFMALALTLLGSCLMYSPDGINWTEQRAIGDLSWRSVAYGNGVFVAGTTSSENTPISYSYDGTSWTMATVIPWPSSPNGIAFGNDKFVACGTGYASYSTDGITWVNVIIPGVLPWSSIAYGNGRFVMRHSIVGAVGSTGASSTWSLDGITWNVVSGLVDLNFVSIAYGAGLFVAISSSTGTGNQVTTSPDGITWTPRTSSIDLGWQNIAFANSLFVAVAPSVLVNNIMTSPDGITWTTRSKSTTSALYSVTGGNGLFCALSSGTDQAHISKDGITWVVAQYYANASNRWFGACFGAGLFVAVAEDGNNRSITCDYTDFDFS